MKAWRLLKDNTLLQIFDVDSDTRQVTKTTNLSLKKPMTESEAQVYMEMHFPFTSPRDAAFEKDLS